MRLLSFILSLVISLSLVLSPTLSYSDSFIDRSEEFYNSTKNKAKGLYDKSKEKSFDIYQSIKDRSVDIYNGTINVIDKTGKVVNVKVKDLIQVFSDPKLLKYMENLAKSASTRFDKAMDVRYLETRIGGGNHRLFDGGHTLSGSYSNISKMCNVQSCTSYEKYSGWMNGLWKDMTTPRGLPFVNMEKATYDDMAKWMSKNVPGVDKKYVYDALSYDIMELVVSAVAIVAIMYALNQQDYTMLSELLGSIGITSIATANPILAIIMIVTSAYLIKTGNVEYGVMAKGAGIATIGFTVGSVVAMPVLVEMIVLLVILGMLNKYATKENMVNSYEVIKVYMKGIEFNQINFNGLYKLKKQLPSFGIMDWLSVPDINMPKFDIQKVF